MSKNVSSNFKSGHSRGYNDAKSYASKSELAKWVDAGTRVLFGSSETKHSKEYNNGRNQGESDYYRNR